jgi:hypothetical protein
LNPVKRIRKAVLAVPLVVVVACAIDLPAKPVMPDTSATVTKTPILTQQYDNLRTGANTHETALSVASVASGKFGLLYSRIVQGAIYATPLFVPDLEVNGKVRDVLFVVTEHDDAYAFDVTDPTATAPLWHVSFGIPIPSSDYDKLQGSAFRSIIPEVGVTSTPVIDLVSKTMFVFAQTREDEPPLYRNRLHALDITTGVDKQPPVDLVVSNGTITIPDVFLFQRPALALYKNTLVIAGGGHGDWGPYHGWVLAYDTSNLSLLATWLTTPDGKLGGIWQSGAGPAIDDDGDVYVGVGNGTFDTTTDPPNLGNALARVRLGADGFQLVDWFVPFNQAMLNMKDWDLGSTGMMLVPNTRLALGGGKNGTIYVVNRDAFGHTNAADDSQIVQSLNVAPRFLFATPIYWDGETGKRLYTLGIHDAIRAYRFDGNRFEADPYMWTDLIVPNGIPGGALSLSSDGNKAGSAVVWALTQADTNNFGYDTGHGALHAFDADNLSHELYKSPFPFDYVKFSLPAVAAGKVFVGTASNEVLVFGIGN